MLKTIERSRLDNCKIKMVHFNHEGEAGCKIFGRKSRHGIGRSFFSMDHKKFEALFGAEFLGHVEFDRQLVAHMKTVYDLAAYGQELGIGFDFSGGWSFEYTIPMEMCVTDGPEDAPELEFRASTPDTMTDLYQIAVQFGAIDVYRTRNGFYCFKVAQVDDGEGFYSIRNWMTIEQANKARDAA